EGANAGPALAGELEPSEAIAREYFDPAPGRGHGFDRLFRRTELDAELLLHGLGAEIRGRGSRKLKDVVLVDARPLEYERDRCISRKAFEGRVPSERCGERTAIDARQDVPWPESRIGGCLHEEGGSLGGTAEPLIVDADHKVSRADPHR